MKRIVLALALLLGLHNPLGASQGSCIIPTTGSLPGLVLVNDLNACHQAILSLNSGASAPATPSAGTLWYNTNTGFIQQYDGVSWLDLWFVDATNHLITPSVGGGRVNVGLTAAATVDLGSVPQTYKTIIGASTSISSFGSSAKVGTIHVVRFGTAQTLINSVNMFLVGGASFTVTAGDFVYMTYLGGGAWHMISYTSSNLSPVAPAYTFLGNPGGAGANRSDISIPGLAQKVTPAAADKILIADSAAANAFKYVNASSLAALAGVTTIDTRSGAFTTANGIESTGANVIQLPASRRTLPTTTILNSGTDQVYTTPAGALWLEVRMVGGGGGGGGGNNTTPGNTGTPTCLALSGSACPSSLLIANGGTGGAYQSASVGGSSGGGYLNMTGASGGVGSPPGANYNGIGGTGGSSCLGGSAGGSASAGTGGAADANSGSGGGGGGATNGSLNGGGGVGGASGGCVLAILNNPAATYVYTIGTGGAGAAGASISSSAGGTGGAGAAGRIAIIVHYGS